MKQPSVLIKKIFQKDNESFVIEWSDGLCSDYRLADLQKNCPCAQCCEETGQSRKVAESLRAVKIMSVGRYAMRIQFSSGCSKGIYTFAWLRHLEGVQKGKKHA